MIYYRQICARYSEVVEVKLADWKRLFNCSNITAIVFSGSQWMISENDLNDELKSFVRQLKLPTLGICFGHQLLARSFGAKVKKGAEKIERAERIRILEEWEIFAGQGKETVMMASHQEYVSPNSIQAIGWQIGAVSDSCPVEAIRHPTLP
ncbi:MAG: type 1 glutamine amidotransferase, partial [bacterium]